MSQTFSSKSNAKRAAIKEGLDLSTLTFVEAPEGRWSYEAAAPASVAAEAAEDDFAPPAFLAKDAVANPTEPRAEPAEEPAAQAPANVAVENAFRAYLAADDRSDEFMRSLFAHCFLAGKEAAAASRKPRGERTRRVGPSKREIAANLLARPEGTTTREILDATGWPAVSVPAIAKASGMTLRQEKVGRVTRYFGQAA